MAFQSIVGQASLRVFRLAGAAVAALLASATANADRQSVVDATYADYSVLPPTASQVVVCHGFGCKDRTVLAITPGDRAHLAALLGSGRKSPAAERDAVGRAGAWFDRRIGPEAGTVNHMARAGVDQAFKSAGQLDCIDSSRNATTLLLLLADLRLLRHHTVDVPVARGYLIDGRPPHVTAILRENKTGERWTVDPWTRRYGQSPEIMPLARWLEED